MSNVSEEAKLLELIRGSEEEVRDKMTIEVLKQIKILNDSYLDILNGMEAKAKIKKIKKRIK